MKNISVFLILSLCIIGCDTTKQAQKNKTDTETKNNIIKESFKVTETKRQGGDIKTTIIPENKRERELDGSIKELTQTIRDGGLTKTIYYKPDGSVNVDCKADEIWERIEEKLNEKDLSTKKEIEKEKNKTKDVDFQSEVILYGFLGIGFIVAIISFFLFRYLNQNTKALNTQ